MSTVPEHHGEGLFSPTAVYTVRETAQLLKVGVKAVRGAIRRGDLTAHRLTGDREYRLLGAYVLAWIQRCEVRCDPTAAAVGTHELVELRVARRRTTQLAAEAPERLPTSPKRSTA
jgi:excisionase family DNA binding protein